jgi:hypothetical protein
MFGVCADALLADKADKIFNAMLSARVADTTAFNEYIRCK